MSLFFFDKPDYAETHFKFKLPWSLLYRAFPEVFFDAPFQVVQGKNLKIWLGVKEAQKFPVTLLNVTFEIFKTESNKKFFIRQEETPLSVFVNENLFFIPFEFKNLEPGHYEIFPTVKIRKGSQTKKITRFNFPGLKKKPLQIQILEEDLPKPKNYFAGEFHTHSAYSNSHVEFGAPLKIIQECASLIGLDFVNVTDHSYDFQFQKIDYTKEDSAEKRFLEFQRETETLEKYPLCIASEEISAGNFKNENVHLLSFGNPHFLPGLGDSGRYWLKNKPTLSLKEILKDAKTPFFAAHPQAEMNALERFVFNRGYYSEKDIEGLTGLQFWNGVRDAGFFLGKAFWIQMLEKKKYLLPIGGNDAHGDFNDTTSVSLPLFKLRYTKDHVFGKVRTVIRAKECSVLALTEAFQNGELYVTNGPALWFEKSQTEVRFFLKSSKDFGAFYSLEIFGQKKEWLSSDAKEILIRKELALPYAFEMALDIKDFNYVRAEAKTNLGYFVFTAAVVCN